MPLKAFEVLVERKTIEKFYVYAETRRDALVHLWAWQGLSLPIEESRSRVGEHISTELVQQEVLRCLEDTFKKVPEGWE